MGAEVLSVIGVLLLMMTDSVILVTEDMGDLTFMCPEGWTIQAPNCYLITPSRRDFMSAQETCKKYGANLVIIEDEVESMSVSKLVRQTSSSIETFWIGNMQLDGQSVCGGVWDIMQPTDLNSTYVSSRASNGRWSTADPASRLPFVCKFHACVEETFRCMDGSQCLNDDWKCDGEYDCPDQSDEADCNVSCTSYTQKPSGSLNVTYEANRPCTWVIEGVVGQTLSIIFHTVDLESDADYIEVWSGGPTIETSTQKALFTGSLKDRTVYGDNNFLIIRLISDNSVIGTGFTATWQTDAELSSEEIMVEATDSWTEVKSPHYNNSQRPSVYFRQFTVNTTDGSHITMEIIDNQLMVDDFEYNPQELSMIVSSSSASPLVFVSLGSSFTFQISSKGNSSRAFRARVKRGCSPDLTLTSGVIESPGPTPTGPYPSSLTCTYTVRAPSDHPRGFVISFLSFKLADNKDEITVYNVTDSVSNQMYTSSQYKMSSQLPQKLYSGSVFVVEFNSSLAQSDGYFALNFSRDCPAMADTSNMSLSTTLSHAFTFVNITCNNGYSFAQEEFFNITWVSMTCSQDGNWDKPRMPTCGQTYCGVPRSIANGEIYTGSGNARYRATVEYRCFPGFSPNGSSTSTCQENGQWTNPPECQSATCPPPPSIVNGILTLNNTNSNSSAERQHFGAIVMYICNPGYDLIGSSYSLCYTANWSLPPPVCQAIKCPVPEVDRATLSTQSPVELGMSLNITCNPGYTNNGTDSFQSTCTSSGIFDVPRNVCQDKNECDTAGICGTYQKCDNTDGNFTCVCQKGYTLASGKCEDINECANNTSGCDVTNGYCNNTSGGFTCVCNSGYTLYTQNGTTGKYIPLSEDGLRHGDVYYINHTCVPVTCPGLPSIPHGTLLSASTSYVYNETVEYRCDQGYTLTGSGVVKCQSNGNWSAPPPVCNPKYCAVLSPTGIVSAVIPQTKTVIGDKVTLVCRSQVGSEYNKTLYCAYDPLTDNMTLQGDSPNCPAIDCGSPSLVATGGFVNVSTSSGLGDSFEFSCAAGFALAGVSTSGNKTVRCGEGGRWGFGTLSCGDIRCTDPGTPGGMNMTSASFDVNGTVNYTCLRRGYVANPQARTCVYVNGSAQWNGFTPVCVDIERPVLSNCPPGVIYRNIYTSAAFAMPSATDNSGLVLPLKVSPPGFRLDMPLAESFNVTFTASDATGNNVTCQVAIIVRDPSVFPELTCPDRVQYSVSSNTSYTVDLQTDGNVTGVNLTFSPSRMVQVGPTTLGAFPYHVTTTDMYGFQRQCTFMVDIKPTVCLSDYLTPGGATKQCTSQTGGSLTCSVTCGAGMAFQDGSTTKTYSCSGQNVWSPTLPARSCTPMVVSRYIYTIAINYTWNGTGNFISCLNQSAPELVAAIPTRTSPCPINGGPSFITFNASVVSLDKNEANLVLELTIANLMSVTSGDFEYCRITLSGTSQRAIDLITISSTSCTGQTGAVTFTPQNRNVTSNSYVCPRGSTLQLLGAQYFCVQCEPGYMENGGQCTECPTGQYQNETGQTQCKACAGNFSSSPRVSASQCVESCPLGFANGQGVVASPPPCYACPVDTYLNTSYTANCTACPSGSTTYGTRGASLSAQCKACPPGEYPVNSTSCSPCPRGYYKTSTGYTKCTECPANTTTNSTGSSASTNCTSLTSPACQNGGTPVIYFHKYICTCPEGYYGTTCENSTNACDSNPCYNNGDCYKRGVDYKCGCASGFSGYQCEVDDQNDCQNTTCSDISFCRDKINSSDCVCPSVGNYTGPQCAVPQDLCSPNPCKHGATCQTFGAVRYTCQCLPGYTGNTCETLIDQCALNSRGCLYGGHCNNGINNYTCSCKQSYQGSHCQQTPDYCNLSNPCPSGVCYNDYMSVALCACSYPYRLNVSSSRCEEIDVCLERRPCQNNATCQRVSPGQFHCSCLRGYEGSLCQHIVRSCTNSSCAHGQCLDVLNSYTCVCDTGYNGSSCEVDVNDCPGRCNMSNTRTCIDGVNQYTCSCKAGFTGVHCETNINECASLPCKHNGTCIESATPGDYSCICRDGWTGKNCDTLPDFCSTNFCQNGGVCYSLQDRHFCSCLAGTHGTVCNETTNICSVVSPCADPNQCQSGNGTASCNCSQNYTGGSCQLVKDFCSTNPCQTSQCVTTDVGYSCRCQGTDNCTATDLSCASATCPNGSSCVETASSPLCLCQPGYLLGGGVCKNTSSDFDIYFTRRSNTAVRALQPFTVTGQDLSLTFWISFLDDSSSFPVQLVSDRMDQVLLVSQSGVSFGGTFAVNFTDYNGSPQSLSAQHKWTFCAITWSVKGQSNIYINSVKLQSLNGIPNGTFPSLGSLLFSYIGEDFAGYISQLNVWNRTLTSQEALALYANYFASPTSLSPSYRWAEHQFNSWVKVISPSTVMRDRAMCQGGKYDNQCANEKDKRPPVTNCSTTDLKIPTYRQIQLFDHMSTKMIFPGDDPVMTNMNGTLLTFGAYHVVYISTDTEGNVAMCRFNVYVQREGHVCNAGEADYGDSVLTSCGAQPSLGETVTCPVNSSVTPFTPKVLTCGKLGSYNLDDPYSLPPAQPCSDIADVQVLATLTLKYLLGVSCGNSEATSVKSSLQNKVKNLAGSWPKLCNNSNNCDSVNVSVVCNSNIATATLIFHDLLARLTSGNVTYTVIELLKVSAIEEDTFNMTFVANAVLLKDEVTVTLQTTCRQGYGRFGAGCVQCVSGSFLNSATNMCDQCVVGTYTNTSGQTRCTQCPPNQTTLRVGSTSCVDECSEGRYYNLSNNACQPCFKNFYQPNKGRVACFPCPPNTFTEGPGTVSLDKCHAACPPGSDMRGTSCVPCARGSYRTGLVEDDKCQNCSAGRTTASTNSTSSIDCYQTACSPGYMRNATNQCVECDYGYYQPEQWQDTCLPCNINYTTNNTGSTSSSYCIFVCPAGSEDLGNHICQPCPRGFYRANSLQDRFLGCTACNTSFTTVTTGSTSSSDCNITACSPGHMRDSTNLCVPCYYGYYQPNQWQDSCLPCNTSYTTNNTGSTNASDCKFVCPPGYEDPGNQTCQLCQQGYFRSNSLTDRFQVCTACNASFTTAGIGSTSSDSCNITACFPGHMHNSSTNKCVSCDYGYYQPLKWQDMCFQCNANYTTANTASTNASDCRFVCPPGYEDPGNQTCQPCQQGYFRSNSLTDRFQVCTACNANFTTAGIGSTSSDSCNITACFPGHMHNSSTNKCVLCDYGYYQPLKWQDMCFQCNANYTTANTASTNASDCRFYCQAGYEVQTPGVATCSPCARGMFKTNDGDDKFQACKNCSIGNTTDGTAAVSASFCNIKVCMAGQVIENGSCVPCPANFYQNETVPFSYTKCIACPPGSGTRQNGQTSQAACSLDRGACTQDVCLSAMCGSGQQHNSTVSQCVACPQGTWNSGNASQQFDPCASCPATYVTVGEGATSPDNCTLKDCPPGEYIATNDSCKPCPNGTYQDARRQYNCIACPAGTNTSREGITDVRDCTVYCNAGQEQKPKTENCTSCLPDFIKNFGGYGLCTQCSGNFTSNAARTVCDVLYCDKGFRPNTGGSCDPCEVGFYKDQRGNSSCIQCPANSTTASVASTSNDNCSIAFCEPGLYSVTNQLPCLPCPLGTYKTEMGNKNCTLCPANLTTPHTGSVTANSCSLVVCPAGQSRDNTNMCQDCDTGYYQSQPGQTTCQPCSANYTTDTKASTSPENCTVNCPPGQYRDTRTSCQKCVVGSYQPNYGAASCINCTTNFTTAGSGSTNSSDCFISCRPGSYRPSYSKTECLKCPFNKYQNVSSATECIPCSANFFTRWEGSTLETDCLPKCSLGEYLNIAARTCYSCPVGTYNQIGRNITECTPCPENKITIGTGAQSVDACNITDCDWGQYRVNGGCMNCSKGWYQPQKSQDSCIQCPPGNTTLLTGQIYDSSCIDDCADGTAYNLVTNECEQCIIGYYRKKTETMGCVKCSPGKTTLSQGASSCVDSAAGTTTTPSPVIKRYVLKITIRMQIKDCSNKVQMTAVIRMYILNRLQSADAMFPALCAADCQADLSFYFIDGCLSSSQRKKRDIYQDVLIQLTNVTDEISGTGVSGQNVTEKSLAVVTRAFYDTKQDASLLADNGQTFVEVIYAEAIQQCNPGQRLENTTCVDCSAGYVSTNGASSVCTPCEMNTYQEASGQTSCKPCSLKAYTSTIASTSSSNCTKLCDRPNARQTYCSDHGTCVFDETTDNGVMCKCDDNWSNNDCNTRQEYEDKQIPMVAGIIGGLAGFLLLVLLIVGIVVCMKRATKQKKNKELLQDDMYSDMYQTYNTPLRENHALPQRSIMYLNPSADDEVMRPAPSTHSRKRSDSYEGNWKDLPELKTHF